MTLNANFAGARVLSNRLTGPERTLDTLIGLIVLFAVFVIGFMSVYALYQYGLVLADDPSRAETASAGFAIALFGGAIPVAIATLVYLVRIVVGRRSWRAPLWGGILMTVAVFVGYGIMSIG